MTATTNITLSLTESLRSGPYRRIWNLSWPTILSNLTVPLLGAVDTAVMGHLPDAAYVGAVAVGAMIFSFVYWGFGFLRMGTVGFAAQAKGSGDTDEIRAVLARALLVGVALAFVILALQTPVRLGALAIIDGAPQVERLAGAYFDTRIWGAPATLANYSLLGWLLGMQYVRTALVVQVFINGLNVVLDLWFVLDLGWGVEGVALATAIAQYAGAFLALFLVRRHLRAIGGRWRRARILDATALRETFRVNRDIFLRTLAMIFAWSLLTWSSARLGTTVLAANAILMNFQSFLAHGLDGFAHATSALVGEAVGARDRRALRRCVVAATVMAAIVAAGYTLIYASAGPAIVRLFTNIAELRTFSSDYLVWIIASPLLSVWSYQLDGIFIGATRSAEMRNAMLASVALYVLAMATLPALLGNHGLWLSVMIFMVARALTLAIQYPKIERAVAIDTGEN
ncbi:MAG: MATE family efflux transporter [Alphaproteobacteria bacterium]|nr:MATE family efflux transporter [Alphaproteobacteria bacterium]MCZ6845933.1 MATE family efflux transporter [Alphaproteobacteria bacterium]